MNLKDKIVVITGASRGLGKEMALIFAKKGAKVIVSGRSKEEIENLALEIGGLAVACDATKEAEVNALAQAVVEKFGRIDVWVNNAGIWTRPALVEDYGIEDFRKMIDVNLFGTVFGCRAALRQMKKQEGGIILNMISSAALSGRAMISGYSSSKFAADGFTKAVREEVKDDNNIKVINAYPGGTKTNLFDAARPSDYDTFWEPSFVANFIVENLEKDSPEENVILKRPGK